MSVTKLPTSDATYYIRRHLIIEELYPEAVV
jgi:hypothetical protein